MVDDQPDLSAFDDRPADGDTPRDTQKSRTDACSADPEPDADADGSVRSCFADLDRDGRVALGVALLEHLEYESLPLPETVNRIETITTSPALTREILDTAELRGIIDREDGRIRTRSGGTFVQFDRQIIRRAGDYECRRCGASLETGHFIRFDPGELGPFGPDCVRKVLGRV